jgi:hypothetical protein
MRESLRLLVLTGLILGAATASAAGEAGKNFVLTIDGREVGLDLGETVEVPGANGQKMKVALRRAEQVTFRGGLLSFSHRGDLTVSSTSLDKDITQHLIASANGTVIIVQEYTALDPTSLLDLMLTTITDEPVAAGAKLTKAETSREVAGRRIKGLKAELVSSSDKTHVETYTLGGNGKGVIIITQLADDFRDIDRAILDGFWSSLSLDL